MINQALACHKINNYSLQYLLASNKPSFCRPNNNSMDRNWVINNKLTSCKED